MFTERTFELLAELKADGHYKFYQANEEEFQRHLVIPFKKLINEGVIPLLPKRITDAMEVQKRIFGQINKNDFRGGANAFYWSAFYPLRSKSKLEDFQLLTFINADFFKFGFFMGWRTNEERIQQLMDNYDTTYQSRNFLSFVEVMENCLSDKRLIFRRNSYDNSDIIVEMGSLVEKDLEIDWQAFFEECTDDFPMLVYPSKTVIEMSFDDLSQSIVNTFAGLFPLIQLATSQVPEQVMKDVIANHNSG